MPFCALRVASGAKSLLAVSLILIAGCHNSGSPAAPQTVMPPATLTVTSLTISTASIAGGGTTEGTVTLSGAAPAGGTSVTLASDSASAVVPASIVVSAGASSAVFAVTTTSVAAETDATISASSGGVTRTAVLRLTPAPVTGGPIASVSARHDDVIGGENSTGTVTLGRPAPPGGIRLALSSSDDAVNVPSTLTIPAGSTTGTFYIDTVPVESARQVRITIAAEPAQTTLDGGRGATTSTVLTILVLPKPEPTLASINPTSGDRSSTVTVTFTGTNFVDGATTVAASGPGITVSNVVVASSTSLTADLTIDGTTTLGARDLTVTTPAGTSGARTFTTKQPSGTETFSFMNGAQEFTVPDGVTSITIEAWGAQGGDGLPFDGGAGGTGGAGGYVEATFAVSPGDLFQVNVGGQGAVGDGLEDLREGGGGGGASDVRSEAFGLDDRLIVAGGGGGGGGGHGSAGGDGGAGGGLTGGPGGTVGGSNGGQGGTQFAGGAGGGGVNAGNAGDLGVGGTSCCNSYGGAGGFNGGAAGNTRSAGGGGGHYGGGGGSVNDQRGAGGGGGSSFTNDAATSVTHQQGVSTGDGVVIIRW